MTNFRYNFFDEFYDCDVCDDTGLVEWMPFECPGVMGDCPDCKKEKEMKLTDIVRDVAIKALKKPGSIIECMVDDGWSIYKGQQLAVKDVQTIFERGLNWLPVEGPERGVNPLGFRLVSK